MNKLPPTSAMIAERAYLKWEAAGQPDGRASEFWFQAEQELRAADDASADQAEALDDAKSVLDGPEISNTDTALLPEQRQRARAARRQETQPAPTPSHPEALAPPHFVVVLDRAHLRIYRQHESDDQNSARLDLVESVDLPAGKRSYVAQESDQAGRFSGSQGVPTDGSAPAGGSIDERLPMQEEHQRRIASELGTQLDQFLQRHPESTWDYAAGPALHYAVLERLSDAVRDRLNATLLKDLVHQPAAALRTHFEDSATHSRSA